MTLTLGSLFSGVGGLELGLERAGMQVRWQVEVDDFCQRVLAKHWPHVTRYRDVRDVGGRNLERVDVICGGFPCQDISSAGRRAGIRGERSGLWVEFARVIREVGPRYVLVENVAALAARGLDVVLGDLADAGFDAGWRVLSAADFGAPHIRERLFLLAARRVGGAATGPASSLLANPGRLLLGGLQPQPRWPAPPSVAPSTAVVGAPAASRGRGGTDGVGNGVSAGLDGPRLKALGNAVVPAKAEWLGRRIVAHAASHP